MFADLPTISTSLHNSTTNSVFPIRPWLVTCYSIISLTGISGNSLVLYVIKNNNHMKTSPFGTYLGGLALADLLISLSCLPIYLTSTSAFTNHPTGIAGDIMCKVLSGYVLLFQFCGVSIYTMVAIAVQRYQAICKPLSSRATATPGRARKIIAAIWLLALMIAILAIYGEKYAKPDEATIGAHCKFSVTYNNDVIPRVVYMTIFTVQYIIPVCCMTFCFVRIRMTLNQQIRLVEGKEGESQMAELKQARERKRTVTTVLIVVVSYFLLWTPNQILYTCFNFHVYLASWDSNMFQVSVVLCFFSSCINPVIYAFRSQQFRTGFKNALGFCNCTQMRKGYRTFSNKSETSDSKRSEEDPC